MRERRAFVRHQPSQELLCKVNVVLGGSYWTARVGDISTDGIGIISDSWLPAETTLVVEVRHPASSDCRTLLAHLCHATRRPSSDYQLGARVINHLTEEQVGALIEPPANVGK